VPPSRYQGDTLMLYKQIQNNERILIDYLLNIEKKSISEIARILKRNKSTISREIKRNTKNNIYSSFDANLIAKKREWHKHSMYLLKYEEFSTLFIERFDKRYHGVEATLERIKAEYANQIKIPSLKQIYNWINSNR